jgi:uncharacterized membrane protein
MSPNEDRERDAPGDDRPANAPAGTDSAGDDAPVAPNGGAARHDDEHPDIGDLMDELEELEDTVDTEAERRQVRETIETAMAVRPPGTFGRVIRGFDRADAAEALIGALLFGIPMAVEGGTEEVGEFLATEPLLLAGTLGVAVAIVHGILFVAELQDVRVQHFILGIVPRRLAGVLLISAIAAGGMLTAWGRVDWGADPWVALCTICVAFVPMSIGAALGDILPGS